MIFRTGLQAGRVTVTLDALSVIYHVASGQTHVVTEPIPQILAALDQGPGDVGDVLARLDLIDDETTRAVLRERLEELVATGLVDTA